MIPAIVILAGVACYRALRSGGERLPFAMAVMIISGGLLMLVATLWPQIIPYRLTIPEAAASVASLRFLFYGVALVVMPVMLVFTVAIYWNFRGKVSTE